MIAFDFWAQGAPGLASDRGPIKSAEERAAEGHRGSGQYLRGEIVLLLWFGLWAKKVDFGAFC